MAFLTNTEFVGQGIELTDKMRVTVAGWAVRLLMRLPFGASHYYHVEMVTIHPGNQVSSSSQGEMRGGFFYCHIYLAWGDVLTSIKKPNQGSNAVLHEFAHALDLLDREMDGVPSVLLNDRRVEQWSKVFSSNYILEHPKGKKLWDYLGLSRWREYDKSSLDCVDISELFAVATEKYFEDTARLHRIAPELYRQMNLLYKQHMLHKFKGNWFDRLIQFLRARGFWAENSY